MTSIILHQWVISPFCHKIRRILELKGIEYQAVNYNGLKALKAKKLTKTGKLPVLECDGKLIQDSSDIAEFLESLKSAPSIYPIDHVEKAQAKLWEDWADESLIWFEIYFRFLNPQALSKSVKILCEGRPGFERAIFKPIAKSQHKKKLISQGLGRLAEEQVMEKFFAHLDNLETYLAANEWLVGDKISIADIAVSSQLAEVTRTSVLAEKVLAYPKIREWLSKQGEV